MEDMVPPAQRRPGPSPFGARAMEGGFSGETYLVEGPAGPAVLRLYGRDPQRAAIDASLLHLVRGLVPVPRVLDLRRPDPAAPDEPAHLLTTLEPGERLSQVLPYADDALRDALAASVAGVLGALSAMPFLRSATFLDADLHLARRAAPADGLVEWLDQHIAGGALRSWDPTLLRRLQQVCARADDLLDAVERSCLVHSDFNPKNILVDPQTGTVSAVVDWEYSMAGSPYADLGNLLRFERGNAWSRRVLDHFVSVTPPAPADPLLLGYASDLWALVELAARAVPNPVTQAAGQLLTAVARTGDLAARP
jgi:aminoglycoside phosphotransferase (APT) family kinase protein